MLCVSGRAKACLDQFEDSQQEPQKFSALKEQLKAIFDSPSDREAKMADFEQRIQNIDESEEEFMTSLTNVSYCQSVCRKRRNKPCS